MRKQLLGRFASLNMQKDFEDEVVEAECTAISFKDAVDKLMARYKPTRNTTFANFEFHKLAQQFSESFDMFVNRVKHEAKGCEFSCGAACTIKDIMIRDQIIVGTIDDDIRKMALRSQLTHEQLLSEGHKLEAASFGCQMITQECSNEVQISRVKRPGKYSRKNESGVENNQSCENCSSRSCLSGKKCPAYDSVLCVVSVAILRVQGHVVGRRKIGEYNKWMKRKGRMIKERKIAHSALALINSYFSGRKQRTKIGTDFSNWVEIILSAAQGSIIGPLAFNIYINDIFFFTEETEITNYADDNTPFACDTTVDLVIGRLERLR